MSNGNTLVNSEKLSPKWTVKLVEKLHKALKEETKIEKEAYMKINEILKKSRPSLK